MHLIKPAWVTHQLDDARKSRGTIYSLDPSPDNSRLATGGIDSLVRVWSTAPVLSEAVEKDDNVPKLLSTLASHTGPVMAVRWSNTGSYLASGSDDRIVMIWSHDGSAGGKVWGSDTTNVEGWKASKRLIGHNSDVTGVDWSADDNYLGSTGLDNVVLIWSGSTFECIRKLDGHLNFVKGLVFDPVGQYLATQADDNSLKVWRTDSWTLHADVKEPFDDAPKAGVMRPTWSPDGNYIVAPNSMNGPVFCAAVIARQNWKAEHSLIGHPDIVQVAAYNPLIFVRDPSLPLSSDNLCSLLALCAQGTVSLWFTDVSEPFLVLADVMDRDVLDMRWSRDGKGLWISSSEGHVGVLSFSLSEYAPVAPDGFQAQLFQQQYGVAPRVKQAVSRPVSAQSSLSGAGGPGSLAQPNKLVARKGPNAKRPRLVQPVMAQPVAALPGALVQQQPFAPAQPSPLQQAMAVPVQQQSMQVMPVQQQPQLVNPFASAPTFANPAAASAAGAAATANAFASTSAAQLPPQQFQQPQLQQPVFHPPHQAFAPAGFGAPPPPLQPALETPSASSANSKKRKSTAAGFSDSSAAAPSAPPYPYPYPPYPYPYPPPPGAFDDPHHPPPPGYLGAPRQSEASYRLSGHTLSRSKSKEKDGEEGGREQEEARELVPVYCLSSLEREVTFTVTNKGKKREDGGAEALAVPAVVSMGRVALEDKEEGDVLEWRNFVEGERKGESEITVVNPKKSLWVDYAPKYVVCATGSPEFCAVSLEDGSLIAWSPSGRRIIPTLVLDAPCAFLVAEGSYLLALTALGTLTVFNFSPSIPKPRSIYPPLSISSLLVSSSSRVHPHPKITTSALLPNGTPLIALSTGATFSYDADLASWTRLSEPWWAKKSEAWEGRRGRPGLGVGDKGGGRGIIRKVESAVNEVVVNEMANGAGEDDETTDEEEDSSVEVREEKEGKENGDVEMNGTAGSADKGKDKEVNGDASASSSNISTPKPPRRPIPQGPSVDPTRSASDYRTATTLAHLETRLQAAERLDSPAEYKVFLSQYARRLAEEGLRSKAEELVRELLGPVYHKPGKKDGEDWCATVVGLNKRDLLKDVLRELGKSRTTQNLANEYNDVLRKVQAPW
ncbi:hypothetical protein JCM8547_003626 [Rhodosporidiobolus lusitaniae]